MDVKRLFDVFSRRPAPSASASKALTGSFRNRVLMLCRDRFGGSVSGLPHENHRDLLWQETHTRMQYLVGRPKLSKDPRAVSPLHDLLVFLESCADSQFLDFVESIFQVSCYWKVGSSENDMVDEVNHLFAIDDLPYALTPFIREERMENFFGSPRLVKALVAYPRVVRKDANLPYVEAIRPAIDLLHEKAFVAANVEFVDALSDFRRGDFGDCLTKCASAFESTLKIICFRKKYPYTPTDTASVLLRTVLQNSSLESFFEQPLILVATMRNRLSTAHGAGTAPRSVSPHVASYAINITAAAILLLVAECS